MKIVDNKTTLRNILTEIGKKISLEGVPSDYYPDEAKLTDVINMGFIKDTIYNKNTIDDLYNNLDTAKASNGELQAISDKTNLITISNPVDLDFITSGGITPEDRSKLDHISVTSNIDLDAILTLTSDEIDKLNNIEITSPIDLDYISEQMGFLGSKNEDLYIYLDAGKNVKIQKGQEILRNITILDPDENGVAWQNGDTLIYTTTKGWHTTSPNESDNIWGYFYYADSDKGLNRVVGVDPSSMTMKRAISCKGDNPHSAHRAGMTDYMFGRTQSSKSIDILDVRTNNYYSQIDLSTVIPNGMTPRGFSWYNKFKDLMILSGEHYPVACLIQIDNGLDAKVVATVGDHSVGNDRPQISGNQGGHATGHSAWLDRDHFIIQDRYNDCVRVFKVTGQKDNWVCTQTQEFYHGGTKANSTAGHYLIPVNGSDDGFRQDSELDATQFFLAIEGSAPKGPNKLNGKDIKARVVWVSFDATLGQLSKISEYIPAGITSENSIHHIDINPAYDQLAIPISGTSAAVDNAGVLTSDAGLNLVDFNNQAGTFGDVIEYDNLGFQAGHTVFSIAHEVCAVTSHKSSYVALCSTDKHNKKKTLVKFSDKPEGTFNQSHNNYTIGDGQNYYFFATDDGDFVKMSFATGRVVQKLHTGGKPEQSVL